MSTCIIFNPTARGDKARRFREHLASHTRDCELRPTSGPGIASELARTAVADGFETLVAAGGDGTLNEVLNGMGAIPGGFTRSRLAVLPLGTINLFARELGIPGRLEQAWETIQQGRERRIDVACADYQAGGRQERRYFVQTAGAGLDARAIDLVSWEQKKRLGSLAYVVAGLKALRGPLPPVTVTDGTTTERGPLVLIGNGRFYGGSWHVFPLADLQDGLLEVTVFPRLNPFAVLRGCSGVVLNRLHSLGGVKHFRAPQLELTCTSPEPFHVEGENVGHLPVRLSVLPGALRVITA